MARGFSKRSAQVEAELEAQGADYEAPGLRMRADETASLATRADKDHAMTPANLIGRWAAEAGELGLPLGADLEADVLHGGRRAEGGGWSWDEVVARLVEEETGLCAHAPRFAEADVIEHLCALSGGAEHGWRSSPLPATRIVPSTTITGSGCSTARSGHRRNGSRRRRPPGCHSPAGSHASSWRARSLRRRGLWNGAGRERDRPLDWLAA